MLFCNFWGPRIRAKSAKFIFHNRDFGYQYV